MENKILITTHEATTLDQMAKDSAERWEKEKQLDEILKRHWMQNLFTFDDAINQLEVARHFNCTDTSEVILNEIKDMWPEKWQKYLQGINDKV